MLLTFICECKTVIFHDSKRPVDAAGAPSTGLRLRHGRRSWWSTDERAFPVYGPQEQGRGLPGKGAGGWGRSSAPEKVDGGRPPWGGCCQRPSRVYKGLGACTITTACLSIDSCYMLMYMLIYINTVNAVTYMFLYFMPRKYTHGNTHTHTHICTLSFL